MDFENRSVYAIYGYAAPDRRNPSNAEIGQKMIFKGVLIQFYSFSQQQSMVYCTKQQIIQAMADNTKSF